MASIEKMKEILMSNLRAFTQGDWNAFKATLTDDSVYEEEATGRRAQGGDEIVKAIAGWKSAFPDAGFEVKSIVGVGDALVIELEWTGTHKAALSGPFGTLPPTGKLGKLPAVEVVRFEGERIRETHHYFDLLTLLRQLGVAPQMGAPGSTAG